MGCCPSRLQWPLPSRPCPAQPQLHLQAQPSTPHAPLSSPHSRACSLVPACLWPCQIEQAFTRLDVWSSRTREQEAQQSSRQCWDVRGQAGLVLAGAARTAMMMMVVVVVSSIPVACSRSWLRLLVCWWTSPRCHCHNRRHLCGRSERAPAPQPQAATCTGTRWQWMGPQLLLPKQTGLWVTRDTAIKTATTTTITVIIIIIIMVVVWRTKRAVKAMKARQ